MGWILLSVAAAMFEGVHNILSKQGLKKIDEKIVLWGITFGSFIFLCIPLALEGIPPIGDKFLTTLIIVCVMDTVGALMYLKAIKETDLSLALPLMTFTPLFLLFTSPFMVGEVPSFMGCMGVILIVVGSYCLNIHTFHKGPWEPFKALVSSRGPRIMLACAFLFSFTCNFHKIALLESSPIFYSATHQLLIAVFLLPFIRWSRVKTQALSGDLNVLPLLGLCSCIIITCQMCAFQTGMVAYVTGIKRTSVIFSICLAWIIFRERGIRQRLTGATIMVSGAILTAI